MIPMVIHPNGDGAFADLQGKPIIHIKGKIELAILAGGMKSGKPSVALRFELPDGQTVIAETSAALFVSAARVITAKHPELG